MSGPAPAAARTTRNGSVTGACGRTQGAAAASALAVRQQDLHGDAERSGEAPQRPEPRRLGVTPLDALQRVPADAGPVREGLLREVRPQPSLSDALADGTAVAGPVVVFGRAVFVHPGDAT